MTKMKIRSFSILSLSILLPALALAQSIPQSIVDAELPSLVTIYKDFHTHPELSTKEQRSSAIVAKELRAAGCEVTENFGSYDNPEWKCYGVVGVMKNGDGPTVSSAHGHGCLAGTGTNRRAVREHGQNEECRRPGRASDARVRS